MQDVRRDKLREDLADIIAIARDIKNNARQTQSTADSLKSQMECLERRVRQAIDDL